MSVKDIKFSSKNYICTENFVNIYKLIPILLAIIKNVQNRTLETPK